MRSTIARSAIALAVGAGLTLGLAACSDDAETKESETASEQTDANATVDIEGKQVPKAIADKYNEQGAAATFGALQQVGEEAGSPVAIFDHARIYLIEDRGVVVKGEILNHWLERGGVESDLGKPLEDEVALPDGTGWSQLFEHGTMFWTHPGDNVYDAHVQLNPPAPADPNAPVDPNAPAPAPADPNAPVDPNAPAPAPADPNAPAPAPADPNAPAPQ